MERSFLDPTGWLLAGSAIGAVLLLDRVFRMLFRRRELEEGRYRHQVANQLPRELEFNGTTIAVKLEQDAGVGAKVGY